MRTVRLEREEFVGTVQANRDRHRGVFEEALEGYRSRLLHELEQRIKDLKRGRRVDVYIRLTEPEDHTEDYDRILTMAKMSVDSVVELTQDDFAMYVMAQWHWRRDFDATTSHYLGAWGR